MPIYEYRCSKCADEFEVMQKITDGPLRKCRKCPGRLEKLISRTSFQLKGGGWYDSGYTKSGGGNGGGSGKSSGDGSGKSSSGGKSTSGTSKKSPSGSKDGTGKAESKSA